MILNNHLKRTIDIVLSLIGLSVLLPLLIIIFIMIVIFLGRPIFFRQLRPGLYGYPFELIKFRTMLNEKDSDGIMRSDSLRITRFGRFLRSTSLDELPELWNVLKGDMSLVGPRPLLMEYLSLYSQEQLRRHEVRPGITGWAQINGRNVISWQDKFKYDIWYVDNNSILLDMKILFITIKKVVLRENISAKNEVTMYKFKGDED